MYCISCREMYIPHNSCRSKECCDGVPKAKEKLLKQVNAQKAKVDFLRLSSSLNHVSNSKFFTDVVLFASDALASAAPIPAYKSILMSHSPVFRAMFENNIEESRSSTIKISKVSYETLQTFVEYLYTGKVCRDEQMAFSDLFHIILKHCFEDWGTTHRNMEKVTKGQDYIEIVEKNLHLIIKIYEEHFSKKLQEWTSKSKSG
ncbi:hypothetical protein EUTSA_v10024159mg [Eutrema salsugineum]|uniref:BTB domain-containing protein n=1 Tax=Eutrema salsugineum TaxID=72664 RepID=V4KI84_EUTSA|nr:hypothetical protein EUTSA_v10024159mg [Eutrema salsugineum]